MPNLEIKAARQYISAEVCHVPSCEEDHPYDVQQHDFCRGAVSIPGAQSHLEACDVLDTYVPVVRKDSRSSTAHHSFLQPVFIMLAQEARHQVFRSCESDVSTPM